MRLKTKKAKVFATLITLLLVCPTIIFAAVNGTSSKKAAAKEKLSIKVKQQQPKAKAKIQSLPVVGSYENLKEILKKANKLNNSPYRGMYNRMYDGMMLTKSAAVAPTMQNAAINSKSEVSEDSTDYSKTNVQVQGVDEADVVKTDGKYIYQVNRNRIMIFDVKDGKKIKLAKNISFNGSEFNVQEMFIDNNRLVVIGCYTKDYPIHYDKNEKVNQINRYDGWFDWYGRNKSITKAITYNIADPYNPQKERELEVEGNYISSRKIGANLYIVTNKSIMYYPPIYEKGENGFSEQDVKKYEDIMKENFTPVYRDTAKSKEFKSIGYNCIRYFPDAVDSNYINIASVNLDKKDEMKVSSYMGYGENIYVSSQNMYVASNKYNYNNKIYNENQDTKTIIYKFGLKDGDTEYSGKGEVKGTILNQFSMDEDNGYFRIATTSGNLFTKDAKYTSKNNLYVLDNGMKLSGKLEDIAPTEKIYSVRFVGDKAYMVTFKKVDPLFVIDMKDPKNPKILGKLKIPGYSDYIQPYDENHIIGFGKEAIDPSKEDVNPNDIDRAYYQGMKIAMFDVSDVNNPKEMFKTVIGDRGTDSELLENHKALLFSKEKNLMAFPVTVMEVKDKKTGSNKLEDITQYGDFSYQGMYVYNIDMEKGFVLKGRVTHISKDEYDKAGDYYYDNDSFINRGLYIGNNLYTLSNNKIKLNSLDDIKEITSEDIP